MIDISIVLPSIHAVALRRTLHNIRDASTESVEVIVVSPLVDLFSVPGLSTKWVDDPYVVGPCATQTFGVRFAEGEFVLAFSDDFMLADGWDRRAMDDYEKREAEHGQPYLMGLRFGVVGTVFGSYYPNFPFARTSLVDRLGWYDQAFERGFGDCDLGLRVWEAGGRCEFSAEELVTATQDDARKGASVCSDSDLALFTRRWAPTHGWDAAHLDGFNINVAPDADVMRERTIRGVDREKLLTMSLPRLVGASSGANVVHYRGKFYRVPMSIGPVNLESDADRGRDEIAAFDDLASAMADG